MALQARLPSPTLLDSSRTLGTEHTGAVLQVYTTRKAHRTHVSALHIHIYTYTPTVVLPRARYDMLKLMTCSGVDTLRRFLGKVPQQPLPHYRKLTTPELIVNTKRKIETIFSVAVQHGCVLQLRACALLRVSARVRAVRCTRTHHGGCVRVCVRACVHDYCFIDAADTTLSC